MENPRSEINPPVDIIVTVRLGRTETHRRLLLMSEPGAPGSTGPSREACVTRVTAKSP
jgi:hypothetical protein